MLWVVPPLAAVNQTRTDERAYLCNSLQPTLHFDILSSPQSSQPQQRNISEKVLRRCFVALPKQSPKLLTVERTIIECIGRQKSEYTWGFSTVFIIYKCPLPLRDFQAPVYTETTCLRAHQVNFPLNVLTVLLIWWYITVQLNLDGSTNVRNFVCE